MATPLARALRVTFNLPNSITWTRLLLSIVVFVLIAWQLFLAATIVFIAAAWTDQIDGYLARKYNLITVLGRILDPLVDKVIVCGTFIFLITVPAAGIAAWMVAVIVIRELLVTGLRGLIEQRGEDFSASLAGKVKMVLQCIAAPVCLAAAAYAQEAAALPNWAILSRDIVVWVMILATLASGALYVVAAAKQLWPQE